MALTTFALLFRESFHTSAASAGVIAAASGAALVVTTLGLSTRLKPHQLENAVMIALALLAISLAGIGLDISFTVSLICAILLGISGGLGLPALTGATQRTAAVAGLPRERSVALFTVVLSASLAIGPLVESGILSLSKQDLELPFLAFSILPIIALVILIRRSIRFPELRTAPDALPKDSPKPKRRSLSVPQVRRALYAQLMYAVPFAGLSIFGVTIAHSTIGATPSQAQLAFTAFFIVSFASRSIVAWRAPILHKSMVIIASGILTCVGIVMIGTGQSFLVFVLAMAVLGIPHGAIFPLALALIGEKLKPEELPRANAIIMGSSNVVGVAAPAVLGVLIASFGYRAMVLLILVPVVLLLSWTVISQGFVYRSRKANLS